VKENKVSLIIVVSVLGVGCAGAGEPAGNESSGGAGAPIGNVPSETVASTVLSSVSLDNGETVEFRAYGNDRVAVVDIFKYGQHQAVPANAETMTLSQIYASVAPGQTVPAAIRDAEQRLPAATGALAAPIAPPPAHDATASSPAFYDFHAWFQPTYCPSSDFCGSSTGRYLIGPWRFTNAFTETGGLDGAATSSASLYTFTWNGTAVAGVGNPLTVPPGSAVTITYSGSPTWYYAFLTQASGNAEEDLAQKGAFANVWSVIQPLDTNGGDIRYYTADGDWAPQYLKYECGGAVDVVAGFSSIGYLSCGLLGCSREWTTAMLCASLPQPLAYGSGYTLQFQTGDDRRDTSTGDWAPGLHKAECAAGDGIVGMAQFPSSSSRGHSVEFARCAPIGRNVGATNCEAMQFQQSPNTGFSVNAQESPNRGDWKPGSFKGECSPGRYVKGIAKDLGEVATLTEDFTGTKVTTILCCSPTTN
jgi:hypothetical protein